MDFEFRCNLAIEQRYGILVDRVAEIYAITMHSRDQ
jgi:hypothetical protein